MKNLQDYLKALNYPATPTLFLDLESLDQNIKWISSHSGDKSIRLATKSIRSVDILRYILDKGKPFRGIMTYDLREALWLRDLGMKDILMGYPTFDRDALEELAKNPQEITLMIDRVEHLELIEEIFSKTNKIAQICLDVDMSLDLPGLRFGVYRSSLNSLERLKAFHGKLSTAKNLLVTGLMGYEAQIAGVIDKNSSLIRRLKRISVLHLRKRRLEMVRFLESQGYNLKFINGGGTGSLISTREENCVTEITVGSGFYCPVLFDHYKDIDLTPALFFSLPIVRKAEENIYTCTGGGYIASGSTDTIKSPTPFLPAGAKLLKHEGAGEVQTPLIYSGPQDLKLGDSVIFRHAKAGEVCERFLEIKLLRKGSVVKSATTYRGEGKTFV
jgi:D-serine deaminase-like pyridoxal phosphate-dependent protein